MKNIFFKMYGSAIMGALVIILIFYGLLLIVNKHRYNEYLTQSVGGTFLLMVEGISRHQGEKQQQWIDIIERLTGLELEIEPLEKVNDFKRYKFEGNYQTLLINSNLSNKTAVIAAALPNNENEFVVTRIRDINQTIARVTAILILNELGRYPKNERVDVLHSLKNDFSYDISLVEKHQLLLSDAQWRQLSRGDVVIDLTESSSGTPLLHAYARYGNSGLLLSVGPMASFQRFPMKLVLPLASIAIMFFMAFSYLLVHAIEKKLRVLEEGIKRAGTNEAHPISLSGNDGFSRMASSVNDMMNRIDFLVQQQRQLTHDISHELRTPIARIMFRVQKLSGNKYSESDKNIASIQKDLSSLDTMIDEILTSAKLDHSQTIVRKQFDIVKLLKQLCSDLEIQFPNVSFIFPANQNALVVNADRTLLARAIENLLINGCRHCSSTVAIVVSQEKSLLTLHIEDDGIGIPIQYRERIFDPFFRIDESRNRMSGGFGLGLSIVKKIVLLHGGEISAGGSSDYGGASFQLHIPTEETAV